WIPVDVVAATCDLAVHHGGGTTATTFMTNAVPQIIIPENPPEFPENYHRHAIARALTTFGAGMTLMPQTDKPDQNPGEVIAAACQEIISTPRYSDQARALSTEIRSLPTPSDVVNKLEKLTV